MTVLDQIRRWFGWARDKQGTPLTSRLVMSEKLFDLPPELVVELRQVEASREYRDGIMGKYGAFLLDPGLGPATYLLPDGRVLWSDCDWGVEGTQADVYMAIVVGAYKTGVRRLLDLLPPRPLDASDCQECDGTGWFSFHGQLVDVNGSPFSVVCMTCAGLGWRVALDGSSG
jgi:hypothetical protein